MIGLKEAGKSLLALLGSYPDTCAVKECGMGDSELVRVLPLDPIDHSGTLLQLCPEHLAWAEERNELARAVADELREKRKEIGAERYDEIAELATPLDGRLPDEVMDGEPGAERRLMDI